MRLWLTRRRENAGNRCHISASVLVVLLLIAFLYCYLMGGGALDTKKQKKDSPMTFGASRQQPVRAAFSRPRAPKPDEVIGFSF